MSKFEDHLWNEFVGEHGDALTQMRRPTTAHTRRARPRLVVGTGFGLAGAGGVVALLLGATTTSPAFAVTRNHDGTVSVLVNQSSGVAGANAKLHQLGIRAKVVSEAPVGCQPTPSASTAGEGSPEPSNHLRYIAKARWTIDPRRVPVGQTLALTPPPNPPGQTSGNSNYSGNSGSGGSGASAGQVWSCGTEGSVSVHSGPPPNPPSGNSGSSGATGNS